MSSLNQEWCFSAHFNNNALLEFYIKARSQLDLPKSYIFQSHRPPQSLRWPVSSCMYQKELVPPIIWGLDDISRSRWSRLQDAEPVQQQRSGGRQRQQRRPAAHSSGAVFHPHRHILRGCVRVGRHSRASRNCDVLGLSRETRAYSMSITAEVGTTTVALSAAVFASFYMKWYEMSKMQLLTWAKQMPTTKRKPKNSFIIMDRGFKQLVMAHNPLLQPALCGWIISPTCCRPPADFKGSSMCLVSTNTFFLVR